MIVAMDILLNICFNCSSTDSNTNNENEGERFMWWLAHNTVLFYFISIGNCDEPVDDLTITTPEQRWQFSHLLAVRKLSTADFLPSLSFDVWLFRIHPFENENILPYCSSRLHVVPGCSQYWIPKQQSNIKL